VIQIILKVASAYLDVMAIDKKNISILYEGRHKGNYQEIIWESVNVIELFWL